MGSRACGFIRAVPTECYICTYRRSVRISLCMQNGKCNWRNEGANANVVRYILATVRYGVNVNNNFTKPHQSR